MSSKKTGLRRVAVAAVAALVAVPALATVASATATFSFDRIAGATRYDTSVATATSYGNSTDVILASGDAGHFPDALTASYLSGHLSAPIMLTQQAGTPAGILARIAASGATNVTLIGGTDAISAAQETALSAMYTVNRLSGANRYDTSAAVIGAVGAAPSTTHTAVLATGANFPDALGGGPLSYVKGMPMALTQTDTLPAQTLSALQSAGVTNVIALGGTAAITDNVISALATAGISLTTRLAGANRSETSSLLAAYLNTSEGFPNTAVNVASGDSRLDGVDALGAAAVSGKESRPTLITNSVSDAGTGPLGYLTNNCATVATGHIFGGVFAVDAASQTLMTAAAKCVLPVGPITLASTSVAQGGTLTGTLANPSTVSNLAAAGCGITVADVPVSGTGTFSLLVPASQAPGACNLVFTMTNAINGTLTTQSIPITVTGTVKNVTAGPDLVSVALGAGSTVVYTFREPVNNVQTATGMAYFHVYTAIGAELNPTAITSSGSTVTAAYADLSMATTASVDQGAVMDSSLRPNPINALGLQTITLASGVTNAPNLVSVGNPVTNLGNITFDFTFDAPVALPVVGGLPFGEFNVVSTDGRTFSGGSVAVVSVDRKTLSVAFTSLVLAAVPASQVVRGAVVPTVGGVVTGDNATNTPLETATVGATNVTSAPDLTGVAVVSANVVRYTFDQPVAAAGAIAGDFAVFDSSGATIPPGSETFGLTAAAVNANASAVDVTFPAGIVGNSIGANVRPGAVTKTTGPPAPAVQTNSYGEFGLQTVTYAAGRTELPDLVSVTKSTDAFLTTTVVYTFDSALPALITSGANQFFLYDATGAQFVVVPGGTSALSNGGMTLTVTNGFTPAQVAAATIGAVDANPGPDPTGTPAFPEGAANAIG